MKGIKKVECLVIFISTEEDTREAVAHGVAGIVVSNHGGRQLDGVLATVSEATLKRHIA